MEFYAVNRDYPEEEMENNNHFSRKLKVDMWIDDRSIGGLPDWGTIYRMIHDNKTWKDIIKERVNAASYNGSLPQPKKKWWQF